MKSMDRNIILMRQALAGMTGNGSTSVLGGHPVPDPNEIKNLNTIMQSINQNLILMIIDCRYGRKRECVTPVAERLGAIFGKGVKRVTLLSRMEFGVWCLFYSCGRVVVTLLFYC